MSGPVPIRTGAEAERWISGLESVQTRTDRDAVREILDAVRREGDSALLRLTERFDGVRPDSLRVPPERCRRALEKLDPVRRRALERARRNVERFHAAQRRTERIVEVEPGVRAWREFRPVERVGAYVPGGRAAYPSSLLMVTVPARIAGCREIVACSPPGPGGEPHEAILATAALLGVVELYAVGGAQAVAAMAYGTDTIPAVDKIFGPGSRWVNAAKLEVFGQVEIDLPAGPSEVAVWAGTAADPELVAAEMLAQAEHGEDSLAVAVLPDPSVAREVSSALERRLEEAPRAETAAAALAGSSILVTGDRQLGARWIDRIAPEHLVLLTEDPSADARRLSHAGSVFLGPHTPVACGDYASGTNHVLPTGRRARAAAGLGLDDFGKWVQFQEMDREGLEALGRTVETLAEWEGLPGHADSIRARELGDGGRTVAGGPGDAGDERVGEPPGGRADDDAGERRAPGKAGRIRRETSPPGRRPDPVARLVRPHLREVEPYTTARSQHLGGILLDANENALGPPTPGADAELRRYPDPRNEPLRSRLAGWLEVDPDRLWIGNGSDEAIDVLLRTLVEPGERVVVAVPTYGVYAARARTHAARVEEVRLDEGFDLDVDATLRASEGASLVLLCSPNNPTGNLLSEDRILALLERTEALVAVDEAYVEFSDRASLAGRAGAEGHRRLAVLRTFSKAWGLAAARVGYLVGSPALVGYMDRAGLPYPLSAPSRNAAAAALEHVGRMRERASRLRAERKRLRTRLEEVGLRVLPSDANFLLFFVDDPGAVQSDLAREHGVVIRDRSGLAGLTGGLRVTVGTREENDRFLEGLADVLGERAAEDREGGHV